MCGITGYIDFNKTINPQDLQLMLGTLRHRGPDDSGFKIFNFESANIGLAQARLSIIDLSKDASLPMTYRNLTLIYNGEVYNYKEIKEELIKMGHSFVTNSDSEVILHAYIQWSSEAVNKFIGMFAIVILDSQNEEVILIRDRAGIKPLYYYLKDNLFLFGSELKPFHKNKKFNKNIDHASLSMFFDLGYVPAPYSIFTDCYKLEAATILHINLKSRAIKKEKYWDVLNYFKKPKYLISYDEAKVKLRELLMSAFKYRMIADVPVGVFLSGGYDSTAVAALLQIEKSERLKTFTIGFEKMYDEAPFARAIAKYIGTDHTEFYCTIRQAQEIIPELPYFFDEPFADSSAIPTILVSRLASDKVKVALSADAGDELFAGYSHYKIMADRLKSMKMVPETLVCPVNFLLRATGKILLAEHTALKYKFDGLSEVLQKDNFSRASKLMRLASQIPKQFKEALFIDKPVPYPSVFDINSEDFINEIEIAMAIDYKIYLQDDILTKVDRATMSASIEGREPFLDHRLAEFAAQLPLSYKFDGNNGKRILKDIVHDYIPVSLMDRPKTGFSLPIYDWLLGDLNYIIDEYLNDKALLASGLFNVEFVKSQIKRFRTGNMQFNTLIWKLIIFQMWFQRWID